MKKRLLILLSVVLSIVVIVFLCVKENANTQEGSFTTDFYYGNLRAEIISADSNRISFLNDNFFGTERLIRFVCLNNNATELELYHIHRYWFPGRIEYGTIELHYFNKGKVLRYYTPDSCSQGLIEKGKYQVPVKMMDLLRPYTNKDPKNYIDWGSFMKDFPSYKCYAINNHADSLEYLVSIKDSSIDMLVYYFLNEENYLVAETTSYIEEQYFEDIKRFKNPSQ